MRHLRVVAPLATFALLGCEKDLPLRPVGASVDTQPTVSRAAVSPGRVAPTLTYRYVVGTALLAGVDPSCTNVDKSVAAANGDTIVVEGEGTFSARGGQNSASGGGTFLHKRADGSVVASGTWTATQLLSFKSYGPGTPQGAPPKWEGGLALIRVHLSPGFDAVLQIDCVLGKPPAGAKEGIRFAVQDALNFNREVSGCTLFIRES